MYLSKFIFVNSTGISKLAQVESFPDEYCSLKITQTVSSKSNILSLKRELHENILEKGDGYATLSYHLTSSI